MIGLYPILSHYDIANTQVVAFVRMAWSLSTNLERFFFATPNVSYLFLWHIVSGCINFEKSAQSLVSGVWS